MFQLDGLHNNIVTDHAGWTCIDKKNDYDLLNPAPRVPPKRQKPHLKEQLRQIRADNKLLLGELKYVLAKRLEMITFELVKPINVVGTINAWVEILTHVAALMQHEDELKVEFHNIFELILHVSQLPTDVQVCNKLKKVEQVIKTHTYQCPRKFHEAWGILI